MEIQRSIELEEKKKVLHDKEKHSSEVRSQMEQREFDRINKI